MGQTVTISTHNGSKVSIEHNLRNKQSVGNPDIDPSRSHLNETLVFEPVRTAYARIFGEAMREYNERQTREERQIRDYYSDIKNHAKKHPVYEMIIQVGDQLNIGNDNPIAREILKEFISDWKNRNPSLELIGAFIHADEMTLHAHLDYIPVATGYKRGMHTQNGLDKALRQQGFDGKTASVTPQILWERRENAHLEKLCIEHGFEVIHPERDKENEQRRVHQTVEEYKTEKIAEEISDNFAYNQQLQQENTKLEKEIKSKKRELEWVKGKILTEKQVTNFKNPDKTIFGKVKEVQTLHISDYKSLVKTAARVKDVDRREQALDEREQQQYDDYNRAVTTLENRERRVEVREQTVREKEFDIEKKQEKVKQGFYYNTDKRLQRVEKELNALKEHCSNVKFQDGHSVLDSFVQRQQRLREIELERIRQEEQKREQNHGFSL